MEAEAFATLISVCLGLGLSAACGFRIFVPFLILNLAVRADFLSLSPGFYWIGTVPALIALVVATALEIGAYYIPWLDNLLDSIAGPAAVVAGVLATASVVTGLDPFVRWTLAVIAGGGVAGAVQTLTTGTRSASTLATAGLGNPLVSSVELAGSLALSLLSLLLPLVAGLGVAIILVFALRRVFRRRAPA